LIRSQLNSSGASPRHLSVRIVTEDAPFSEDLATTLVAEMKRYRVAHPLHDLAGDE